MRRLHLIVLLGLLLGGPLATRAAPTLGAPRPLRLAVGRDAIVTVPYDALAAAGWDLAALDAATIRVLRHGRELPAELSERGVRFVARANDGPFSSEAAYWLMVGGEGGLRAPIGAATRPLVWEPDLVYQSAARTQRGDRWFAAELREQQPLRVELALPEPLPPGAQLDLLVTALETADAHQLTVALNGMAARAVQWGGGSEPRTLQITTPGKLPDGALHVDLAVTAGGALLLDAIRIEDAQLGLPEIDVAALAPAVAPPAGQADTLIIAHASLLSAAAELAQAHRALGQRVAFADVQAAYDAFSFGERDPQAIRMFIRSMDLRPARVVLLGAGSVRMRFPDGEQDTTLIPPMLVDADPKYGEIACDSCYVRLDSEQVLDDALPDAAIGRLPAHTPDEARVLVAKTAGALLAPEGGAWRHRALLVADNDREADGTPDPAGPFSAQIEQVAEALPAGFEARRLLYAPDRERGPGSYPEAGMLRDDLLAAWDAGAALVVYSGHASPWQWAWTSPRDAAPHLLNLYDADSMRNGARLPILVSLTCQSGNIFNPTLQATDERMLLRAEGGIVAALSPVGSGVNSGHTTLGVAFVRALGEGQSIGAAHRSALAALERERRDHDLAFSYQLLGDPDVRLAAPGDQTIYLPAVMR
jgi:hypothetical protein